MFPICFAMKMPVYKAEGNKLVSFLGLKNELFQSPGVMDLQQMPIKFVRFNPDVILRRFSKIGINFSDDAIFLKLQ